MLYGLRAVPWLAYVLYPPILKSGDQVPRWAETELQAMGPLCSREKRMLGLMVGALVLWIFGGDYIDAAMVGYSVVALMLLLRIISWDDIVSNKAAWNVFFWLASLITLATGLNNTGFISWFGKLLAGSLSGYSPTIVMVALIVVFYLLRYFFASATAYTSALAPMMIAAALAMPEIPLPVFCLMVGAAIGLGSILTPYATGPSPIYYGGGLSANGGLLATGGDFWADIPRIAGDYRLTVDARGVALSEDGAGSCSPAPNSFTQPVTPPAASADAHSRRDPPSRLL